MSYSLSDFQYFLKRAQDNLKDVEEYKRRKDFKSLTLSLTKTIEDLSCVLGSCLENGEKVLDYK